MAETGFDGTQRGILARPAARAISPAYVRDALNLAMVAGRVRSRPGLRPAHGASFPDPIRGGGTHYRADGTRDYLVASGAALYRMPLFGDPELLPLTALPSTQQTRIDPTAGVRFLSLSGADNVTFIFDGVNPNLKWDGVRLTKMGLPTPTAPTNVPNGGSAIGAGTRKYYRTLKTTVHESQISAELVVVQGASGGQTFASPVDGVDYDDPQVTSWALYRTTSGFEDPLFIAETDIGLAIDDNDTDNTISGRAKAETDVNLPPPGLFIDLCEHKGRVWGIDTDDRNLVRFCHATSEFMAPEGWPETENVIPVAHGDGDEITRIVSFFEWLVVFKQLTTWAIVGELDSGFQVIPVLAATGGSRLGIGCVGPIVHKENELIFSSRDGAYQLERFAGIQGGIQALKISDAIDTLWNCTNFSLGSAALYDRQQQTYFLFGYGGD